MTNHDEPEALLDREISADRVFRSISRGAPVEGLEVVATPGEAPATPLRAGDVMLRVALGEPGLGHVAVLVDDRLWRPGELSAAGFTLEGPEPGLYGHVIDGGAFPHPRPARFARRILDASGHVPPGQMLLRPTLVNSGDLELSGDSNGQVRLVGKPGVKVQGLRPGATVDEVPGGLVQDGEEGRAVLGSEAKTGRACGSQATEKSRATDQPKGTQKELARPDAPDLESETPEPETSFEPETEEESFESERWEQGEFQESPAEYETEGADAAVAPEPQALEEAFGRSTSYNPDTEDELFEDDTPAPAPTPPPVCFTVSAPSVVPSIGFEFDMSYGASTEAPPLKKDSNDTVWQSSVYSLEGKPITTHTIAADGFLLKGDGNRIELATQPFELNDAGLAKMESVMAKVIAWVERTVASCDAREPDRTLGFPAKVGTPRWFAPADLAPGVKCIFPLGFDPKSQAYYRTTCSVAAAPQATLTLPLARINELVNKIEASEKLRVPGRSWSGPSGDRQGDRSKTLYDAQTAVTTDRTRHVGATMLRDGTLVTRANYSDSLEGLLILLVSYLRSGELTYSSRDWEGFAKAFLPLNVKNPFRLLYANLSAAEKQVFRELYTGPRTKLWRLARPGATLGDGDKLLFPPAAQAQQVRYFTSPPTWNDLIDHMLANRPLTRTGDGPVCKPKEGKGCEVLFAPCSSIIPYESGSLRVTVEMRRIGFNWVFSHPGVHSGVRQPGWLKMTRELFAMARELNR